MSKQIDERVVSMQFDNKRFEQNVHTTIGTLEKLKQSLNLSGASKGLENVNAASKKIDMSGLGSAVDTVQAKFSAMGVVGVTALVNITNQAVNAGKRIVSALAIDPVKTGFSEYELKMGSIQTIMASTGEELKTVNGYLNELNTYSDKTIYSFSDMTQNIGKFTNAGVKLKDAVAAIQGISNVAAVSGANTNEASRAMYNFAQALSAGYVKLIDWKSIELANMGTVEFKQQLIDAAVAAGTLKKAGDGLYKTLGGEVLSATKNFNESLKDEWMTTEVLVGTLKDYADETTYIGKKAFAAAQDVKTLSQMWDVLKESAQSGWAQTWELIVGDYEEAKSMFTKLSKVLTGVIEKTSDMRNAFVSKVFTSKWEQLTKKINEAGIETETFEKVLKETAKENGIDLDKLIKKHETLANVIKKGKIPAEIFKKAIKKLIGVEDDAAKVTDKVVTSAEELEKVVNRVIRGDFGNGADRVKALTEAGYNYYQVQNKVNETLGYSFRYSSELTEAQIAQADSLVKLSDKQLKQKGYTDEQIKALRELEQAAKDSGGSINELINGLTLPSGRELISETFSHLGEELGKLMAVVKEVFFNDKDKDTTKSWLYDLIKYVHDFVMELEVSEKSIENFKTVLEGLKAAFELGHSVASMSVIGALKILSTVLSLFDMDLLDVAAHISEYIIKLRDWVFEHTIFGKTFDKIASILKAVIDGVIRCKNAFMELKPVQEFIQSIKDLLPGLFGDLDSALNIGGINKFIDTIEKAFDTLEKWIKSLEKSENLGQDIINGLIAGLQNGIPKIGETIMTIAQTIWDTICNFFDINSPSKKMMLIGGFLIAGLLIGLIAAVPGLREGVANIGKQCIEEFKNFDMQKVFDFLYAFGGKLRETIEKIDFGALMAAGMGVGMMLLVKKTLEVAELFAAPLVGIKKLCEGVKDLTDTVKKSMKANNFSKVAKAVLMLAVSIGILAASVWLLSKIDAEDLWPAVGVVVILTAIVGALAFAVNKISSNGDLSKESLMLLSISGSLLIMAFALKQLSSIDADKVPVVINTLTAMIAGLVSILLVFGIISRGGPVNSIDKAGFMLVKVAAAMLIMVKVIKAIAEISDSDIQRSLLVMVGIELLFVAVIAISSYAGAHAAKAGSMLLMMSGAMLIMVYVIKSIAEIEGSDIAKGLAVVAAMELLFAFIIGFSTATGKLAHKAGAMMLMMGGAILIMAWAIKLIANLSNAEVKRGLAVIAAIEVLFAAVIAVSQFAGENAAKAGTMLLTMAGALLIISGVLWILKKLAEDPKGLGKALGILVVLEALFAGIIYVTKFAKDVKIGTIIALVAGIAILATALGVLSMIDSGRLVVSALSLGLVMAAFAGMIAATAVLTEKDVKQAVKISALMAGVVVVLGGVIYALSALDVQASVATAKALSLLLITMTASMAILGKSKPVDMKSIGGLFLIGLVVAELAAILGLMSGLNVEGSIKTVTALSGLLIVMTGVLYALSLMGPFSSSSFVGIGALAVLGLVVGELAAILGVMAHLGIEAGIENATSLSLLLVAMSASLVLLGVAGSFGPAAFVGIGALAVLITGIGGLIIAIGALMDKFPKLEEFLNKGIPVLEKIGYAIGSFFGNIIGGLIGGISMGALTALGVGLSAFMIALNPFIVGCKMITKEVITGAGYLAGAIALISAANFLAGISSLVNFGGFAFLGLELSAFMNALGDFIEGSKNIDPAIMEGVKTLAEAVLILTAADLLDGIRIFRDTPLEAFSSQLPAFGTAVKDFVTNLGDIKDSESVKNACNIIKTLAEAAKTIPNEGGIWGSLFGENSIGAFGAQLPQLAKDIQSFTTNLGEIKNSKSVNAACEVIKTLAEAAKVLPNDGGTWGKLFGENSIGAFGAQLPGLATNLNSFVAQLTDFGDDKVAVVKTACGVIKELASAASMIPTADIWQVIFGANGFYTFSSALPGLGTNIKTFITNLGTLSEANVTTTKTAVSIVKAIASLSSFEEPKDIKKLGSNIVSFGKKIKSFTETMSGISEDSLSTIQSKIKTIVKAIKTALGVDAESIESFGNALKTLGNSGITSFVNALSGDDSLTKITNAATKVMNAFIEAIEDEETHAAEAMESVGDSVLDEAESKTLKDDFESAGEDLTKGYAKGIRAKKQSAIDAATEVGKAALAALKAAQDSNSPSKEAGKLGIDFGDGYVNQLIRYATFAAEAGSNMGNSALDGVKSAISKISSAVNSKIDAQPTIRPVLDLSSVESGANAIGNMLYGNRTISVDTATVGSISASMQGIQNGRNSNELLSAIKGLRSDMANMPRNSYSINGITYDDGSNVADAVKTLVRAARIERRV